MKNAGSEELSPSRVLSLGVDLTFGNQTAHQPPSGVGDNSHERSATLLERGHSGGSIAPHLALIFVQTMFGTWPIIGKLVLRTLPSSTLVALRTGGASIVFVILLRAFGHRQKISKSDFARLALYSLLGLILNQLLFVKGLSLTTAINATLLGTTIPVFTLLISIALGYDRASLPKALGICVAAIGVIYLVDPLQADFFGANHTIGNLLLIANSISYGAYIAISKDVLKRYDALTVITWIFVFGCLITIPVGGIAVSDVSVPFANTGLWLAVLCIILGPTVGAYYMNAWALGRVEPSTVAVYIYLQPLFAFVLAPLVLHEEWNNRTWFASALIFTGVAIVTRRNGKAIVVKEEITARQQKATDT
jgi:drug/metabolite transporter (DMT)-like permease